MARNYLASHGIDLDAEMSKIQFGTDNARLATGNSSSTDGSISKIIGVRLPRKPASTLWNISIADGRISSINPHNKPAPSISHLPNVLEGSGRLLAPSLCHAHIHLDKCFLLQDPKYSDLQIINGDFEEAMSLTSKAKARFEGDDLLRRGRQLITESMEFGVTCMRAFVEVDGDVGMKCLDAGLKLKNEFKDRCDVQICAFAQLPLFSGPDSGEGIRKLMTDAAKREGIEVVGSTPYVESDEEKSRINVQWITDLALDNGKMLDLHLDYHLDEKKQPLIWSVLNDLREKQWSERSGKQISLGHCTRLTHFQAEEWKKLREGIQGLPIAFVGLPTSDLFMMRTEERFRGTLHVPELIKKHGLQAAIAVNNVGNAFTPQGNCDPLAVASLGVGVYQAGTKEDAETLYVCAHMAFRRL